MAVGGLGPSLVTAPALTGALILAVTAGLTYPLIGGGLASWLSVWLLAISAAEVALSDSVRLTVTGLLALLGATGLIVTTSKLDRAAKLPSLFSAVVLGWWMLQSLNSNVPSLNVAAAGMRKSVFLFVGLWLGMFLAYRVGPDRVARWFAYLLTGSICVALALHNFAPAVEQGFARDADVATATYAGVYRLAGTFAGPFHAGLAASALLVVSIGGFLARRGSALSSGLLSIIGGIALLQTEVRSAFLGGLAAATYLIVMNPTHTAKRRLRSIVTFMIFILGCVLAYRTSPSVASLANSTNDARFQQRFFSYREGIRLVREEPWFGYGSGSAGDTMAYDFAGSVHLTSHNMMLKYAIEGGMIGLTLVICLLASLWLALRRQRTAESFVARGLLILLLVMGISGSIVEALPVSLWLFAMMGAALTVKGGEPISNENTHATVP